MIRQWMFLCTAIVTLFSVNASLAQDSAQQRKRVGMIGLDTSHCTAFTKLLNAENPDEDIAGYKVVVAYPIGSPDIKSSTSRRELFTNAMRDRFGVEIVDTIEELVKKCDYVLLETNDGRPHLEQAMPALKAGKPLFIDKPVAGSLPDAIALYEAARHYKTPMFSSSSLRFGKKVQEIRQGKYGKPLGCDVYSACALEKTHPDLFWYGIHGVELLYTVMGTGCESVTRVHMPKHDFVVGNWSDSRIGTFRGQRSGKQGISGTTFTTKKIEPIGPSDGYRPLVVEIVKFFNTGKSPIPAEETLEMFAFMEAADESKRQNGARVPLKTVMDKARREASAKLEDLLK